MGTTKEPGPEGLPCPAYCEEGRVWVPLDCTRVYEVGTECETCCGTGVARCYECGPDVPATEDVEGELLCAKCASSYRKIIADFAEQRSCDEIATRMREAFNKVVSRGRAH
jgi:hypothetical protein